MESRNLFIVANPSFQREYDENEKDANYGQDQQKLEEAPEAMELPEDLNLEDKDGEEEEGNQEQGKLGL